MKDRKPIPISAAEHIAKEFGYHQVVIIARRHSDDQSAEHVTTYGVDKANCDVAGRMGDHIKYKIMQWEQKPKRQYYYKVEGCPAKNADQPNCICWHDEGTGPQPELGGKAWREV